MAKKKNENTLQYLQMPLPSGGKFSKMTKVAFGGLNKRYTLDSGALTMELNISTNEYPYLVPAAQKTEILSGYNLAEGNQKKYPIGMFAFDDFILVVYLYRYVEGNYPNEKIHREIRVDYITKDNVVHTGIVKRDVKEGEEDYQRSIVQFNVYDTPTDPLTGQFIKKLLIFPDKASMFMNIVRIKNIETFDVNTADTDVMYWHYNNNKDKIYSIVKNIKSTDKDGKVTYQKEQTLIGDTNYFECDGMDVDVKTYTNDTDPFLPPDTASHNHYYKNIGVEASKSEKTLMGEGIFKWVDDESDSSKSGWKISVPPTMPDIKYATVHLSRVFGVDDDRVYASGYNDYTNWNLDTTDEYNEANSWCSPSQSNTKAGGKFTGITTFDSHVICFKRDFMHEIYNTKNPFRLQDIYAEGCIDNGTIQNVDGKLIFVSEDDVKIYTGSNPRIIGYNLNMPQYEYAVSGTDNRNYYLYCEDASGALGSVYVYDTYTDLWSEQGVDSMVISFAHNKNGMYMLCENGLIYQLDTNSYRHYWSFETDLITNKTVDIKHIKKLQMLVDIPDTVNGKINNADDSGNPAYMQVYILYDDEVFDDLTNYEKSQRLVYNSNGKTGRFPIRVKPRKTANYGFKLHIEGRGYVKLYELEIFVEAGGDMYV